MDIVKIIAIGIITMFAYVIVKQIKPEFSIIIGLVGSILILLNLTDMIEGIINTFFNLAEKTGVSTDLFTLVLKIIGIGYLTEFAANLCTDSGCNSIADKILLGGKLIIMMLSLPIVTNLIDVIVGLLW